MTRSVRVPDDAWLPARGIATMRGRSMGEIVTEILDEYVATGGSRDDEPNEMPRRTIRSIRPESWEAATRCASNANETVSEVIRRGLERLVEAEAALLTHNPEGHKYRGDTR